VSNTLYDGGREGILDGTIAMSTASVKALLATSGYTPNAATHRNVSDVTTGNIVARSGALGSKSYTAGVFNAANVTLAAVTGSTAAYIILYADTGTDSTSRLIAIIDTATGLPVTPNGGDITITWDTGSNKIFKL
jgi:hypothetical protein